MKMVKCERIKHPKLDIG